MKTLTQIIQKYLGAMPRDIGCFSWAEMQSKMEEEINELIKRTPKPLTDAEIFAIDYFKVNKLDATKYLMKEQNMGLEEAKDFLDKYANN